MIRHARMRGHPTLFLPGPRPREHRRPVRPRRHPRQGGREPRQPRPRALPRADARSSSTATRTVILDQQRRVGGSCDWGRLRFTMDEVSARAVREAFLRLHQKGLAYRTEALVNWCPGCKTSVSDLEVLPTPETGTLWTVRYHLIDEATGQPDPDATLTVATTRPETILGDTAVAVHPDDPRYAALVGRRVRIPFVERDVPVIADAVVDPAFGTGAVKITPAHDHDDNETGKRHGLAMPTVLDDEARVTNTGTPYDGLDRYEARTRILADLAARGDLAGEQRHEMVIGRCQRSNDVVEPRLKTQWFVRTGPLAAAALEATRSGTVTILPARLEKTWEHWMTNIRDWNVSRQLWWGHRIPAWYCPDGHATVSANPDGPTACEACGRPAAELRPGPRHLRHLVQLGPVAVLDAGLAGADRRPGPLLPGLGHGDGLRHPVLLGRPDDDAGHRADRGGALPHGLPVGPHPRPVRPEDVEDEGQLDRSAGDDRRARRGRAAVRRGPRHDARQRPAVRAGEGRERPELREQALERDAVRAGRQAGHASRPTRNDGSRMPRTSGPPTAGCCRGRRRRPPPWTARWPTSTSARSRASCTRPSGTSSATGAWSSPRSGWPTRPSRTRLARRRGGRWSTRSTPTCACSTR